MAYVDGFVAAVPTANKALYRKHSEEAGRLFLECGALKVTECWGNNIPEGEVTSFPMAVQCRENETVVFSWIVWPSRQAREEGMQKAMQDERMNPDTCQMPFDGQRMIFGGFEILVDL